MSAISGTRHKAQDLTDGTLRVMVDIDPRFKAEFHRLFPNIDMPCAIAPLIPDFERIEHREEEPKGGALCKLAALWCKDEDFQQWLSTLHKGEVFAEEDAAIWVRLECEVESRAQLDHDAAAANLFQERVRLPYMAWLKGKRP